ncbi:MAG: hypothetical protein HY811_02925 [Planctomycetes bacterium]|nr:hypothetical protein [Planctomycetota bacterium]
MKEAQNPFVFYTRLNLLELTGSKARNLREMVEYLKSAPDAVIYYHTHHFLQQHIYLSPEPPNDFAYWVQEILGESLLAEQLSSIEIGDFNELNQLRVKIITTIENYIAANSRCLRDVITGQEFHFIKAITFVTPTSYQVSNLHEFRGAIGKVTIHSLYYHIFEARLRLKRPTNDFSNWLSGSLGNHALAKEIERLDPYTHTMESLRANIIKLIDKHLRREPGRTD